MKLQLIHSHRDNVSHYHPYMIGIYKTGQCPKSKFQLNGKVHKTNICLIYYNIRLWLCCFSDKIICPSLLSWGCILTINLNMLFYLPGFCAVQQMWNYTVSGLYFTASASEAWVFTLREKVHMSVFFAALVKYVDPSYKELEFQVRRSAWYKLKKVNT